MNKPATPTEQATEDFEIGIPEVSEGEGSPPADPPATPDPSASEDGQPEGDPAPDPGMPEGDTDDGYQMSDEMKNAMESLSKPPESADPNKPEAPVNPQSPESESPSETDQYLESLREIVKDNPEMREKVEAQLAGKGLSLDPTKVSENAKEIGELKDIVNDLKETMTGQKAQTEAEAAHTQLLEQRNDEFTEAMKEIPDHKVFMVERISNMLLSNRSLDQLTSADMKTAVQAATAEVNQMVEAEIAARGLPEQDVPPALSSSDGEQDPREKPEGDEPEEEQSADQWLEAETKGIVNT